MLLIERKFGGVTTRKIETQGAWASGSTFVEFNDVKVPVENIIGQLNQGFKVLMYNFNSERIGSISHAIFSTRVAYDEALRYAHKRRTFGKLLIEHPVIRAKLANSGFFFQLFAVFWLTGTPNSRHLVARQIEAAHAWLELVVYQVEKFKDYRLMNDRIGTLSR